MKSQKTKKTSRKFYNKWLYKVSIKVNGAPVFRLGDMDTVIDFCNNADNDARPYSLSHKVRDHKEQIVDMASFLKPYDPSIWSKRVESNIVDIYTNDRQFYEDITDRFLETVVHRFEPDPQTEDLLKDGTHYIVSKKLPHDRYQFRVYLLPHNMSGDRDGKQQYLNWIKKQNEKITLTPAVESWFIKTDWNWDRRYVLVEDEATLIMLKLRNSEVVGRIYNYVVSDK
jgi:hypothetical protein